MRLVLIGPPGAGKGTQALRIAADFSIPHISTGEILRAAVAEGSELGKEVKRLLDAGELVPDETMIKVMKGRLSQRDCRPGFLLDGFPRTVAQAARLDELLTELRCELTCVVNLLVPSEVLVERIKKRAEEGSGRSDDTVETAMKRLQVFLEQTAPVVAYYRNNLKLVDIDGLGTVDEVASRIARILQRGG